MRALSRSLVSDANQLPSHLVLSTGCCSYCGDCLPYSLCCIQTKGERERGMGLCYLCEYRLSTGSDDPALFLFRCALRSRYRSNDHINNFGCWATLRGATWVVSLYKKPSAHHQDASASLGLYNVGDDGNPRCCCCFPSVAALLFPRWALPVCAESLDVRRRGARDQE